MKVHSEWFGSKSEASGAARRLETKGCYRCTVQYAMGANGRHDWLLSVFAA